MGWFLAILGIVVTIVIAVVQHNKEEDKRRYIDPIKDVKEKATRRRQIGYEIERRQQDIDNGRDVARNTLAIEQLEKELRILSSDWS